MTASDATREALLRAHGLTRDDVPAAFLDVAALRVTAGGLAPDDPELAALLAPFQQTKRSQAAGRARRGRGAVPPDTTYEQRRQHQGLRALLGFARALSGPRTGAPRPRPARGPDAAQAIYLNPGDVERHPRARPLELAALDEPSAVADLERDLNAGEAPDQQRAPLPDALGRSPATRRRMRRKQEARRAQAQQLGRPSSTRAQDPAEPKPLPLHEGRKVAPMLRDPRAKLKFMRTLPRVLRHQLHKASRYRPASKPRESYADCTMHIVSFYAFLLYAQDAPRRQRAGYSRAVEGLCREALAAAFPNNPNTGASFDANSLSAWLKQLEQFGLVMREQPNSQHDVYRGPTGWALNVYRMPSADDLAALLRALKPSPEAPQVAEGARTTSGADPPEPSG